MILALTYATHEAKQLRNTLYSAAVAGLPPVVIGWGQPFQGYGYKLRGYYEAMMARRGEGWTHVLTFDAYDTVVLRDRVAIIEAFESYRHSWVCAAERRWYEPGAPPAEWPRQKTPYRYLSAGCWMGEFEHVLDVLHELGAGSIPIGHNDMLVLGEWYRTHPKLIKLDVHQRLCASLAGTYEDVEFGANGLRNRLTGSAPCIAHASGNLDMAEAHSWVGLQPT